MLSPKILFTLTQRYKAYHLHTICPHVGFFIHTVSAHQQCLLPAHVSNVPTPESTNVKDFNGSMARGMK
jgi:hypothetical protein